MPSTCYRINEGTEGKTSPCPQEAEGVRGVARLVSQDRDEPRGTGYRAGSAEQPPARALGRQLGPNHPENEAFVLMQNWTLCVDPMARAGQVGLPCLRPGALCYGICTDVDPCAKLAPHVVIRAPWKSLEFFTRPSWLFLSGLLYEGTAHPLCGRLTQWNLERSVCILPCFLLHVP